MLRTIMAREWLEFRRDRRLVVLTAIFAALALAAVVTGTSQQLRFVADRAAAVDADRSIWRGQGAVNPHSAAHFGQFAFKPAPTLGLFDPGYSPYFGQAVWIEAHIQNPAQARPAEAAASVQRFGDLSPGWILQTLLPLLIILSGFATAAGERERGNLKLQLVHGARAWPLVAGKTLALTGGAIVIVTALVGLGMVGGLVAVGPSADLLARGVALLAIYATYATVWSMLTVTVSSLASTARQAFVILLGIWALAVVLLPRIAAEEATIAHPLPSAGAFWETVAKAREAGIDGHSSEDARTKALMASTLARYGAKTPADLPVDFAGIALQAGEDYGNTVFDRLYGQYAAMERAQAERQLWYAPLSPTIALRAASMGFSGTDLVHQQAFLKAAEQHRRHVERLLNDEQTRTGRGRNFNNTVAAGFFDGIPVFSYVSPRLLSVSANYAAPAAVLLAWLIGAIALLALASRRLEARA